MNIKTAKNIRIIDFLSALGYQPHRTVRYNHFYLSPLRRERTASMKVDDKLNLWYDHGSAQGGTIIDLVIAMQKAATVSEALTFLKGLNLNTDFVFNDMREKIENQMTTRESSVNIDKIQSLQDSKLLHYLQQRSINIDTARKYLHEIHYSVDDRKYKALGWLNNNGGYHLRSEFFKGCTSQGISIVKAIDSNRERRICMVYEGMLDFLSHLTLKNEKELELVSCIEVVVSEEVAKDRVLGRNRGDDDKVEVFNNRMSVYIEPLKDIQDFYESKNILKKIDGERTIEEIVDEMDSFILSKIV